MPSTSAVLTGLSLATGIAREATDGVPIVKQVLGVASRIIGLAEQIDTNREELHALAARAKRMDAAITDIIGDRELDDRLLRRLGDMHGLLHAVEKHFEKHIRQGRVRKTLGYIFTVRKDVDRLRGEFDDRLRELELATIVDTNISAKRNARFNGEFRNIRHCEIELLRRVTPRDKHGEDYMINCHLATCDGSNQVVVVRGIVESSEDEGVRRGAETHNNILEQISLIQNRHPNIAYLYGRNTGPSGNRFVVLKAGDIRWVDDVLTPGTVEISLIGRIVARLVDASCHLSKYGAFWIPFNGDIPHLYLNKDYEPKIGINDDLHTMERILGGYALNMEIASVGMLRHYCTPVSSQENKSPHRMSATWNMELFGKLIDAGYLKLYRETVFRRAEIPCLVPLGPESQLFLRQSDRSGVFGWPGWSMTLLLLATGGRNREGSFLFAGYHRQGPWGEDESLEVYCLEDAVDAVHHRMTEFKIPSSAVNEVRQWLGIPAAEETQDEGKEAFHLQRFAACSATSMECTGWCPGYAFGYAW